MAPPPHTRGVQNQFFGLGRVYSRLDSNVFVKCLRIWHWTRPEPPLISYTCSSIPPHPIHSNTHVYVMLHPNIMLVAHPQNKTIKSLDLFLENSLTYIDKQLQLYKHISMFWYCEFYDPYLSRHLGLHNFTNVNQCFAMFCYGEFFDDYCRQSLYKH